MSALGLGGYGSSDEEMEDVAQETVDRNASAIEAREVSSDEAKQAVKPAPAACVPAPAAQPASAPPQDAPTLGPQIPSTALASLPSAPAEDTASTPNSPYTTTQLLIRDLTMPRKPNFSIPPSPPGSPPPTSTAKIAKFLSLKTQGVHFNEKLETSSALRNPMLLQKLMAFAGIGEEEQYASALPEGLAVPTRFPAWAYADELSRTQQRVLKEREVERAKAVRENVEFVPAQGSANSSGSGTPKGIADRTGKGSVAERVRAGLDREKSGSPAVQSDGGKERDSGRRATRFDDDRGSGRRATRFDDDRSDRRPARDDGRGQDRRRSRSPRRRRSRSR